jgi:hypothetical protein
MHNHMGKTEKAKSSLAKISSVTMVVAIGSLAFLCYDVLSKTYVASPAHQGGHARLRATREEDGD